MTSAIKDNFQKCVDVAAEALHGKGFKHLDAETQVANIFAYSASDKKFKEVCESTDGRVQAELRSQIKYVCELGLDTAKGRKLVYVRTRGLNIGTPKNKQWLTMPDIGESYHALIHILVRSEALKTIQVLHTYQNYGIDYTGETNVVPIVKSWATPPSERGAYTGLFVVLTLPGAEVITSYHHAKDIFDTHKAFSKSQDTWIKHEQAMCAKSAILDAVRYIPVFDSVVASVVEHYDSTMDYETAASEKISEEQALNIKSVLEEREMNEGRLLKWYNTKIKGNIATVQDIRTDQYCAVIEQIEGASK